MLDVIDSHVPADSGLARRFDRRYLNDWSRRFLAAGSGPGEGQLATR